ncbi:MAG TPA: hypothetical protein VFJ85_09560 [Acidimicrobiales bacterium]|nr:hypothetical protein [Acidimicrobiales bacterium]
MPLVRLRPLCAEDRDAFLAGHHQLLAEGFTAALGYDPLKSWDEYLDALEAERRRIGLGADRVPATMLVAEAGGQVVGRVSVRYRLDDFLLLQGGHIGFAVFPAHHRRVGSATVIERCGGRLKWTVVGTAGSLVRRYWIGADRVRS